MAMLSGRQRTNCILDKIEQWAERLPYSTLKIEIELPGETLTLEKNKVRPIGFTDREVKK